MPNSDLNGCQTLVFDHFRFKQRFKHRFKHKFKHRFKHRLKHLIMYKVVPYKTGRHRHLKASVQKPYPERRREVWRPSVNLAPKKYSRKGKVTAQRFNEIKSRVVGSRSEIVSHQTYHGDERFSPIIVLCCAPAATTLPLIFWYICPPRASVDL